MREQREIERRRGTAVNDDSLGFASVQPISSVTCPMQR